MLLWMQTQPKSPLATMVAAGETQDTVPGIDLQEADFSDLLLETTVSPGASQPA